MLKVIVGTVMGLFTLICFVLGVQTCIEEWTHGRTTELGHHLFNTLQALLYGVVLLMGAKHQLREAREEKRLQENTIRELQEQGNAP